MDHNTSNSPTAQTDRMIEWLDSERRKDRTRIAQLEEQLKHQTEMLETLLRRMSGVENDASGLRTQFIPLSRDAELIDQFRAEVNTAFESADARRLMAEREAERRAEVTRDAALRPFREMGDRLEKLERGLDEFATFREERERQANAIANLKEMLDAVRKTGEEPERRLALLEEQRRLDLRRASETQSEMGDLIRTIDGLRPKIELVEQLAIRNEKMVLELQVEERERRDNMQGFVDQQTLTAQQREARIMELTRTFGQYDDQMKRNFERFETWAEAHRQMKTILDDFGRLGERLERRISEVAETQRFSEERFRQEWDTWQEEDERRRRQYNAQQDDAWKNHDRDFDQFRQRFSESVDKFPPILDSLDRLWKLERAQADLFRDRFQSMIGEFDQPSERIRTSSTTIPIIPANGTGNATNGGSSGGRNT